MKANIRFKATAAAVLLTAGSWAAAQNVTLNVSAWKGGTAEPAAFPELIEQFQKENPGITIKLDYVSRNDTTTIMSSRLQSGSGPDVMMVDRDLLRQWGGAGQLLDLGPELLPKLTDDMKPQVQLKGKVYMQPMEVVGIGLFANQDLLKKAGVERAPRNVAEFKAACAKLNAAGIKPLLLPAKDGWGPAVFALSMGLAPSVKAAPTFVDDAIAGKQKFSTNANFVKAIGALKELADAKCYEPKLSVGVDAWSLGMSEFQAGRVAMMPQGTWSLQKVPATINFSFDPLPSLDGNGTGLDRLGTAWAINAGSKQVPAAKKWLAFWTKNANLGKFLQAEAAFSPFTQATMWTPKSAQAYADARKAGQTTDYPRGRLPAAFFQEAQKSMTALMLNMGQEPPAVLSRWDAAATQP